ncbi:MAG: hypothetical protein A3I66_22885 [Burkholderiales bacterium RIFCSPLOWO2_02_FULL_57_36]|nr:MAG: hypothetical protein A3I66_22885 [Burkholderiales bacterium RIFCSPLOWO2_02_FULL_57_36]
MALAMSAIVIGCGGGGGRDPILGAGVAVFTPPAGAIVPGAVCSSAGPTIPTITLSDPTSGNQFATTGTTGVAGGGKLITATFSLAMNAATINTASFVLAPTGGAALVPASVSYNAVNRVATLTTSSALLADTSYTAVVLGTVTSATGTAMGCDYAWSFKTAAVAAASPSAVNLGLAAPFAIAATAGVTNTLTVPITHINGNVVLNPTATCNAVMVDNVGGFGLCGGSPPTINGIVVTPTFPDTTTANAVQADLRAAFLSITPPAGPPAAGSLGGATNIPAGTTLGEPTGAAMVQGDNLFAPGVYQSTTSILVTGDLTLDAQGNPDASFIFQSSSTVGAATGARILLINGAKASNVWWQVGTSATLGTNSTWQGNILASADITMVTGASSCGRLLAGAFTAGAFVFDSNTVSVPGHASAPATCR